MKAQRLVILSDLGQFKAARLETTDRGTPRLETLETARLEAYPNRVVDKVADSAGRHSAPGSATGAAPLADDHNLKLETKRRLIKAIAGKMADHMQREPDLPVSFAAPADILQQVLDELPANLRARVDVTLARDLLKLPQKELLEALSRATPAS
ncbi:MAG: hypothetical protein D6766_04635 [Verrucomicrobia bacterium]|nr:MAG: hypothetical protein D6766_04635 [Verrucomicrobiota bacterium]